MLARLVDVDHRDREQRCGVARALLRLLAERAMENGIEAFVGVISGENDPARQLLRKLSPGSSGGSTPAKWCFGRRWSPEATRTGPATARSPLPDLELRMPRTPPPDVAFSGLRGQSSIAW